MRNKCLLGLGLVFVISLTSMVAFAFSFTGTPADEVDETEMIVRAVVSEEGLTVTHLFLMYGTLRAATLLPTIFTLKGVKLKPEGVVTGIATALIIGLPVFAYGNITGTAAYKTAGSLLTVLLSGTVALIVSRKRGAENG